MGEDETMKCIFPLTSLQIGDLQSYRSHLSIFFAEESDKFLILVDNRPWLNDLDSRAAHLWQLMVTKLMTDFTPPQSRLSPFANTKSLRRRKEDGRKLDFDNATSTNNNEVKPNKFRKWINLVNDAALSRRRDLLHMEKLRDSMLLHGELHQTLFGFIVFEVAWPDVRGINYLNELQTDTSFAIEAKFMKRWEFDSIQQALRCMPSWFLGTPSEQILLREYLDTIIGEVFYDAPESFSQRNHAVDADDSATFEKCIGEECNSGLSGDLSILPVSAEYEMSILHMPPATGPYKRRKVIKSISSGFDDSASVEEIDSEIIGSPTHLDAAISANTSDDDKNVEHTQYRDVLILSRFKDRDLPFKLKDIIMSDLRLLTLLEYGLPSWVIFVQSYPVFCHLYRPWMCPLVRALYVLMSLVTVLIGFYDLYKNVPLLKATVSRLFGPLFDWVENWEMISRIKYLGTMLFLHNFEKAVKWFLMVTRAIRSFLSVIAEPMAGPFMEILGFLLPLWNICFEVGESVCTVVWMVIESSCSVAMDIGEVLFSPLVFLLSIIWSIASSILYPLFWTLWEILYTPVRVVLLFSRLLAFACSIIVGFLGEIWFSLSSISQLASASETAISTSQVSMWRSLWNDLFSQVFRAVRSIVYGFVAFFTACNRHRLSIYNHIMEFFQRLSRMFKRSIPPDSGQCKSRRSISPDFRHRKPQSSISPDSRHYKRGFGAHETLELRRKVSHQSEGGSFTYASSKNAGERSPTNKGENTI
ncbi:hypothetical protein Sjap_003004 [Stephania japonica]|uniref:Uncharacterized protein n=1 Tax=Stephania japonica TaxID=461633 RepID=A0AAP0KPP2_9MAGN